MNEIPRWVNGEYAFTTALSRGARGKRVKFVQEWLTLHNIQLVADGDFGAATMAAVRRFQETRQLPVTGSVDLATFTALTDPVRRVVAPIPRANRTLNQLVVAYAEQHEREHPREVGGQNRGPWVRLYMKGDEGDAFPWCAGFVSFVVSQAARSFDAKLAIPYTVSCDVIAVEGRHRHRFIPEQEIHALKATAAGGSVFLNRRSATDWIHTGIVVRFDDETIETIEGNTNDSGSREGFEVVRRIRGYKSKDFVRLD
ncbi:MAG TPA: peptidoglycan-binding domain-containing protein [Gemmatimonas sp.]|nr:peptidoglycan-binding domain-containing protein [Gemmatimonas sp.]